MKEITSTQNTLVKHLVKLRKDRQYRYQERSVLIEGKKQITEMTEVERLFVTDEKLIPNVNVNEIFLVSDTVMSKISGVESHEGICAEVKMPEEGTLSGMKRIVALDGINDPGNLGTLIRTALALGWDAVFLLPNCCDPFNDKALRAARGATFRFPIQAGTVRDLEEHIERNSLVAYSADISGKELGQIEKSENVLLVLGSEANGISPEVEKFSQKVTIAMPGEMESLNVAVAGGILMWKL